MEAKSFEKGFHNLWILIVQIGSVQTSRLKNGNPFGMSAPTGNKFFVSSDGGKVYEYTSVDL